MGLPSLLKSTFDIQPIRWPTGLPRRFLRPGEPEILVALVRSVSPTAVLEFGVNHGHAARIILDNVPSIVQYQGIDVLPGYRPIKPVQAQEVPAAGEAGKFVVGDHRFELIVRERGSFDLLVRDLKPCDVVFIDGDHSREGVINDTLLARHVVRPGGIIIWHDYHSIPTVDVKPTLDHWFYAESKPIYQVADSWFAFERIP